MRIAVSNIAWQASEDGQVEQRLRDAGASVLEVAPSRIFADPGQTTLAQAKAFAAVAASRGLPVGSMQALLFGRGELSLFADQAGQEAFVAYLGQVQALAGALGCGPMVFGSPRNRLKGDRSHAEARDASVAVFRRLGDTALASGTVFCLEANATGYGCDFMTTLAEAGDVVGAVDHPGVRLVVDTGNMLMAGEPATAIDAVADKVAHVHVSAPDLAPLAGHEAYLAEVAGRLRAAGYNGTVTLEMRPAGTEALLASLDLVARLFGGRA